MRSALNLPVASFIFALLGTGLWFQSCQAAVGQSVRAGPSPGTQVFHDFGRVLGRGTSKDEAREDATRKARVKVESFLHQQRISLEEGLSNDFIRDHLLKGPGNPEEEKEERVENELVKCWSWPLVVERGEWGYILSLDKHARAGRRMALLGKLLAGVVALLAVVAGYIRLDEWTKGYYTGWLRLAGGGLLVLAGLALLCLA